MSYFSQRKKHERENLFMISSLWLVAIVFFVSVLGGESSSVGVFLNRWTFHFYIFNLFLLGYTLWHRQLVYSLFALIFLMLNYVTVARTANLFFNSGMETGHWFNITYQHGKQSYNKLTSGASAHVLNEGMLELAPKREAGFVRFEQDGKIFTVVSVDFNKLKQSEQKLVFDNLSEFVATQDNPVVIVGDFGVPAWSDVFKRFLIKTDLKVKNKILLTDGQKGFHLFTVPTINLLSYNNIGIRRLKFDVKNKKFDIRLTF